MSHRERRGFPATRLGVLLLVALAPQIAFAHPGHGAAHGFGHGFLHPLSGWDHLLAMVAVGVWAGQRGGKAVWLLPAAFVGTMIVGGALGLAGVGLPGVEAGILASVLVLGALIATASRFPETAAAALVAGFALFHGHAHGTEMPPNLSGAAYGAGFVTATAALHAAGIALPAVLLRTASERWVRLTGAGIGLFGLALVLA